MDTSESILYEFNSSHLTCVCGLFDLPVMVMQALWEKKRIRLHFLLSVYECSKEWTSRSVWVCVCESERVCVCESVVSVRESVCVCVSVYERECVCVWESISVIKTLFGRARVIKASRLWPPLCNPYWGKYIIGWELEWLAEICQGLPGVKEVNH